MQGRNTGQIDYIPQAEYSKGRLLNTGHDFGQGSHVLPNFGIIQCGTNTIQSSLRHRTSGLLVNYHSALPMECSCQGVQPAKHNSGIICYAVMWDPGNPHYGDTYQGKRDLGTSYYDMKSLTVMKIQCDSVSFSQI